MKVLIIGAGIGGLFTALKMHNAGIDVEVFETVSELKPLGVGINIQPHATRELAELGLLEDLKKISVLTTYLQYHSKDGKLILKEPRGLTAGYQFPQLSVHRGNLHMALLDAFYKRVGENKLHLSHQFTSFKYEKDRITANFKNRKNNELSEFSGNLLIGADGIHSAVRKQLHPDEKPMQFEGIMMWRGTTYQKLFLDGSSILVWGNSAVQLVVYPISYADNEEKAIINWVVEIKDPNMAKLHEENWNRPGNLSDFLSYFGGWNSNFLDFTHMFKNSEKILEYPMVDRDPLPFWGSDRVTLLGDAAHPMYPRGGNGASQAIIDATCLVNLLQKYTDTHVALKEYEAERISATARIVENNRKQNQVAIFALIDQYCQGKCGEIHTCIDSKVFQEIAENYRKQAGFSVEQVNKNT